MTQRAHPGRISYLGPCCSILGSLVTQRDMSISARPEQDGGAHPPGCQLETVSIFCKHVVSLRPDNQPGVLTMLRVCMNGSVHVPRDIARPNIPCTLVKHSLCTCFGDDDDDDDDDDWTNPEATVRMAVCSIGDFRRTKAEVCTVASSNPI